MRYVVTAGPRTLSVEIEPRDDGRWRVVCEGQEIEADLRPAGGRSLFSMILGAEAYELAVVRQQEHCTVTVRGQELILGVESEQARNARLVEGSQGSRGPQTIKSVMPGRVVRVLVKDGEEVVPGTPLLILEAMKMENEIRSLSTGTVSRILVTAGQTVVNGDPLVTIG